MKWLYLDRWNNAQWVGQFFFLHIVFETLMSGTTRVEVHGKHYTHKGVSLTFRYRPGDFYAHATITLTFRWPERMIRCWCGDFLREGAKHYPGGEPENGYDHRAASERNHCCYCGAKASRWVGEVVTAGVICERCHEEASRTAVCGTMLGNAAEVEPHEKNCPMCQMFNEDNAADTEF